MKSKIIIIIISILITEHVFGQEINFAWSKIPGTSGNNIGKSTISDNNGYLYVAGEFKADFIFDDSTITGFGQNNIFIMKLDIDGNLMWSKRLGSNGNAILGQICFGKYMNIVCTGTFSDTLLLNDTTINSKGSNDIFIMKINSSGETISFISDGGIGNDVSNSLCIDNNNNLYLCGGFTGNTSFGNQSLTSSGYWQDVPDGDSVFIFEQNGYFLKYNSLNEFEFAKQICKNRSVLSCIISDSANKIYTAGYFNSYDDLTDTIASEIGNFLVFKYDQDGNIINLIQEGSNNNFITAKALAIDNENNLLVTGQIGCSGCIFGDSLLPVSYNDAFLVKYDSSGNMSWINLIGQYNGDYDGNENSGNSIIIDKYNNIILSGYFDGIDLNGHIMIGNNSSIDFLVMKFDKNGSVTNIGKFGYSTWDAVESVTIDSLNNIYFTGYTYLGATSTEYPSYIFIAKIDSFPFLGIENVAMNDNIMIYPNPSDGSFAIDFPNDFNQTATISVSSIEGKALYKTEIYKNHNEFFLQTLTSGSYIIKIQVGNITYNKKLIIQ